MAPRDSTVSGTLQHCTDKRVELTAPLLLLVSLQGDRSSSALEIVEAKGLRQMTDLGEIESMCRGIVQDPKHAKQVRSF